VQHKNLLPAKSLAVFRPVVLWRAACLQMLTMLSTQQGLTTTCAAGAQQGLTLTVQTGQ
jgi:hypothetical protein